jgi:hypothetical protein
MARNEKYAKAHAAWLEMTGLKVGDKVRVMRSAKDYEHGCPWSWSEQKEKNVGKVLEVYNIDEFTALPGVRAGCCPLSDGNYYPFFILEVVEQKKEEP